jgi:hypothetical protein
VTYSGHDLTTAGTLSRCCQQADLVVSTLPSGALDSYVGELSTMPLRSSYLDVTYAPRETAAISCCLERGIPVAFGVEMLVYQAVLQFKLMTGIEADSHAISSVFQLLEAK